MAAKKRKCYPNGKKKRWLFLVDKKVLSLVFEKLTHRLAKSDQLLSS
jgi:hypothetical protein